MPRPAEGRTPSPRAHGDPESLVTLRDAEPPAAEAADAGGEEGEGRETVDEELERIAALDEPERSPAHFWSHDEIDEATANPADGDGDGGERGDNEDEDGGSGPSGPSPSPRVGPTADGPVVWESNQLNAA